MEVCCESHMRQAANYQPLPGQASHPGQGWNTSSYIDRPSTRWCTWSTCDP
ncbi:hypothetical protein DPMN_043734 [Dreissena polymorpha]|uniref:Uncharacterized protein n=1 Tax=Dreissena polymorpha TaxID=45954 RepID=A0A9D4HVW5_DREPO|nr:hypothetical protein DPMN_043734 [Dreissena polymorpha]